MHEFSIALEICRLAESRAPAGRVAELVTVGVEVGDDSGVERESLTFCLETLLAQPPFGKARPVIRHSAGDALFLEYLEFDDGRPDD